MLKNLIIICILTNAFNSFALQGVDSRLQQDHTFAEVNEHLRNIFISNGHATHYEGIDWDSNEYCTVKLIQSAEATTIAFTYNYFIGEDDLEYSKMVFFEFRKVDKVIVTRQGDDDYQYTFTLGKKKLIYINKDDIGTEWIYKDRERSKKCYTEA